MTALHEHTCSLHYYTAAVVFAVVTQVEKESLLKPHTVTRAGPATNAVIRTKACQLVLCALTNQAAWKAVTIKHQRTELGALRLKKTHFFCVSLASTRVVIPANNVFNS